MATGNFRTLLNNYVRDFARLRAQARNDVRRLRAWARRFVARRALVRRA